LERAGLCLFALRVDITSAVLDTATAVIVIAALLVDGLQIRVALIAESIPQ
jgi:hypothetical protein